MPVKRLGYWVAAVSLLAFEVTAMVIVVATITIWRGPPRDVPNAEAPNHSLPRKERGIFESGPGQLGEFG
jgi:hypothetical protein